jgi:hypothetical protein
MTFSRITAVFFCLMTMIGAAYARDQVPAEQRVATYTGLLPSCDDPAVLEKIHARFVSREETYWKSGLRFFSLDHIRTIANRPHGKDYIPRRFCTGVVMLSDAKKRRIDYVIGEDLGITGSGFFGPNWNVNWCVQGLDRNMAYAPECRMARP